MSVHLVSVHFTDRCEISRETSFEVSFTVDDYFRTEQTAVEPQRLLQVGGVGRPNFCYQIHETLIFAFANDILFFRIRDEVCVSRDQWASTTSTVFWRFQNLSFGEEPNAATGPGSTYRTGSIVCCVRQCYYALVVKSFPFFIMGSLWLFKWKTLYFVPNVVWLFAGLRVLFLLVYAIYSEDQILYTFERFYIVYWFMSRSRVFRRSFCGGNFDGHSVDTEYITVGRQWQN